MATGGDVYSSGDPIDVGFAHADLAAANSPAQLLIDTPNELDLTRFPNGSVAFFDGAVWQTIIGDGQYLVHVGNHPGTNPFDFQRILEDHPTIRKLIIIQSGSTINGPQRVADPASISGMAANFDVVNGGLIGFIGFDTEGLSRRGQWAMAAPVTVSAVPPFTWTRDDRFDTPTCANTGLTEDQPALGQNWVLEDGPNPFTLFRGAGTTLHELDSVLTPMLNWANVTVNPAGTYTFVGDAFPTSGRAAVYVTYSRQNPLEFRVSVMGATPTPTPDAWQQVTNYAAGDIVSATDPNDGLVYTWTRNVGAPAQSFAAFDNFEAANWTRQTTVVEMTASTDTLAGTSGTVSAPQAGDQLNAWLGGAQFGRPWGIIQHLPDNASLTIRGLPNDPIDRLTVDTAITFIALGNATLSTAVGDPITNLTAGNNVDGNPVVMTKGDRVIYTRNAGGGYQLTHVKPGKSHIRVATMADAMAHPLALPGQTFWIENGGAASGQQNGALRDVLPVDPANPTLDPALSFLAWSGWYGEKVNSPLLFSTDPMFTTEPMFVSS